MKKKGWIIGGVLVLLAVGAAAVVYIRGVHYFQNHFFANTVINHIDCTNMTVDEALAELQKGVDTYQMEVYDRDGGLVYTLTGEDIGYAVDIDTPLQELFAAQDPYRWPAQWSRQMDRDVTFETSFDEDKVLTLTEGWALFDTENMEKPQDAYLSGYEPEIKGFEIIPCTQGSVVDVEKARTIIIQGLRDRQSSVSLESCYASAEVTEQDAGLVERRDALNKLTGARIQYNWNGREVVVDGDLIQDWILEEDGEITLDEEKISEFVTEQAKAADTYGKRRKFTTVYGVVLSLPSGAYGWKTDREEEARELKELILEGEQVENREPVYVYKGYHQGEDDIGDSYVEIDLTNQHLYLFVDGKEVLTSDFVSGDARSADRITPPGVFGITYKKTDAVLRGADYETPVHYWMPFNGNIGMHDATWRKSFGGEIYKTNGSHGCVNLPLAKAKEIYSYMEKGFPVICYYYEGTNPAEALKNQDEEIQEAVSPEVAVGGEVPAAPDAQPVPAVPEGEAPQAQPAPETVLPQTPAAPDAQPVPAAPEGEAPEAQPVPIVPEGEAPQAQPVPETVLPQAPAAPEVQPVPAAPEGEVSQAQSVPETVLPQTSAAPDAQPVPIVPEAQPVPAVPEGEAPQAQSEPETAAPEAAPGQ